MCACVCVCLCVLGTGGGAGSRGIGETLHMLRIQGLFFFLRGTSLCNIYNERRCNSTGALAHLLLAQFTTISWDTMGMGGGDTKRVPAESGLNRGKQAACAAGERREFPSGSEPDRGPRGSAGRPVIQRRVRIRPEMLTQWALWGC